MNLILTFLWLAGGCAVFLYQYRTGDPRLRIFDTGWSLGWVMLLLSLYNLARWWNIRSRRVVEQALQRAQAQRERAIGRHEEPPDPNFDFTNEPPPQDR